MTSERAKELSDKVCEILQEFKNQDVIGEDFGAMFVSMDMTVPTIQLLMGTSGTVFRQMIYNLMDGNPKLANDIIEVAAIYMSERSSSTKNL